MLSIPFSSSLAKYLLLVMSEFPSWLTKWARLLFLVDVFDSFVDTILTYVFRWELVVISRGTSEWNSVVHVVNIFFSPLSKVSHKSIQIVSLRHIDCTIFVVV